MCVDRLWTVSSRGLPSSYAALCDSSSVIPGFATRISSAASSGLKYSTPSLMRIAPAMLLLHAVSAGKHIIHGVCAFLGTLAGSCDYGFT